ncbi:hypothetical protein [uncultured Croceitalea sp.]|uniref:hypothetical protein n=1 Tax=uncultured Croceitalea sp. TaxID=1798908 RepID=UPI003305DBD3
MNSKRLPISTINPLHKLCYNGTCKKERIVANANIFDFELFNEDVVLLDAMDQSKRFGRDPNNFNL